MKNWLTIGQFSKKIGVSNKAIRLYEKMGLIQSHARGENRYRYFELNQIGKAKRLKEFKDLGFTLAEIKSLLQADQELDSNKIVKAMKSRLGLINNQVSQLSEQRNQIEKIGGVIGNGEEIEIFGFNLKPDVIHLKIAEIMTQE